VLRRSRELKEGFMLRLSLALMAAAMSVMNACSPAHYVAKAGREAVIGMDARTLKGCAGIPTRVEQIDSRTTLYSYENKYERTGGAEVTLPIIGGGFSLGGSGSYCHAIVRMSDGRVAAVNYAGDNDDMIGTEGICAPIFRGCLREQERARQAGR
jgi:hypothetical protein